MFERCVCEFSQFLLRINYYLTFHFYRYMNSRLLGNVGALKRVEFLLGVQKIHLQSELKVGELALAAGIHPRRLPSLIKAHFGCSFSRLIAKHRVIEARQLLAKCEDKSIFDVALDSGFSNVASFYRTFKCETGQTPVQYQLSCRYADSPSEAF